VRAAAAVGIYRLGSSMISSALESWCKNAELATLLLAPRFQLTVGVAVDQERFARIHKANGQPPLAHVPPDQNAQEFELHFAAEISLDILTTKDPARDGAIARYLAKFGEGIQQVEVQCQDVARASTILRENFGLKPVYAEARPGANDTLINFFLVPAATDGKVLVELYEIPGTK
jgi:hypothetical protein